MYVTQCLRSFAYLESIKSSFVLFRQIVAGKSRIVFTWKCNWETSTEITTLFSFQKLTSKPQNTTESANYVCIRWSKGNLQWLSTRVMDGAICPHSTSRQCRHWLFFSKRLDSEDASLQSFFRPLCAVTWHFRHYVRLFYLFIYFLTHQKYNGLLRWLVCTCSISVGFMTAVE